MNDIAETQFDTVEHQPMAEFSERAYLEYAMYVILDRALPHIGDGLKPVQRRIIYAMSELNLSASAKFKKSARTVGDVLGKFHPHGDSACYEAMVHMAQDFSFRYPLVDGQGNWGAPDDPKSFAAMRYTEAKLSKYAEVLLAELNLGTVDRVPNFDGSLTEPAVLPARLPNVLLNGATGIAVGMATDIPPHNIKEVAAACIHLIDNPKADTRELMAFLPGPDYPTDAEIITPADDIWDMYETGTGSIRIRATYEKENGDIVINALPFQTSGAKILEQIAAQMQAKKLPMVADLRDESDHEEPTRLVVVPRSNRVDVESLMAHLFATTDLERSFRVNMNVICLNGRPRVMGMKHMLAEWITFRTDVVTKRLSYRLGKVTDRLHVLAGLLIAFLNIDEVIHIIRTEDKPKPVLMERFQLSDRQAESILELKLRHLAKLEEIKITAERDELESEREYLEKILGSPRRLKTLIKKEIKLTAETFGDDRRSRLVVRKVAQAMSTEAIIPVEPVTVIMSAKGWIRMAKGHEATGENLAYKAGDRFLAEAKGKSSQPVVFLDDTGRSYALTAHGLPSARSHGDPLGGLLSLPAGAEVKHLLMAEAEQHYMLASDVGYGFVTTFSEMITKNKSGKQLLTLPEGADPLLPVQVDNIKTDQVVVVTTSGRLLVFPISELPLLSKGKGNKIIHIPASHQNQERLMILQVMPADHHIRIFSGKRHLSLTPGNLSPFFGKRGRRGQLLPRGYRKVDKIEFISNNPQEEVS